MAIQVTWRSLSLARDKKERGYEAWVLRVLGEIASHCDPPDVEKAKEHYHQAMALAEEACVHSWPSAILALAHCIGA